MSSDSAHELLAAYVHEKTDAAFRALVAAHLPFVYNTALRLLSGDTHRAEEVAQDVFTDLARKAPALLDHPSLTGWLHTSARYAATQLIRSEQRRRARENTTAMDPTLNDSDTSAPSWENLRPLIDDALADLNDTDRSALLLRFFSQKSLAEVGAALGLSEDTARKRVDRALEKLTPRLKKRGLTSAATALGLALAAAPAYAAPAGLAANISTQALTAAAATTTWLTTLTNTVQAAYHKLTASAALSTTALLVATTALTTAAYEHHQISSETSAPQPFSPSALSSARASSAELDAQIARVEAALHPKPPAPSPAQAQLARLRANPEWLALENQATLYSIYDTYAPLFAELNLPPEKQKALEALLVERLGRLKNLYASTGQASMSGEDPAVRAFKAREYDDIRALLGESSLATYKRFEARQAIVNRDTQRFINELADRGTPLTAEQERAVTAAFHGPYLDYLASLDFLQNSTRAGLADAYQKSFDQALAQLTPKQRPVADQFHRDYLAYIELLKSHAPGYSLPRK